MAEGVTFQNYEQLQRVLAHLTGEGLKRVVEVASQKLGEQFRTGLMKRPAVNRNYPLAWASKKQRAWYFATRREKNLPMGYTRDSDPMSQRSHQRWVVAKQDGGAIVGNSATYAPWVQSDQYQTEMHRVTGWPTDKSVDEELKRSGIASRIVAAEIKSMLDRAFK